MKTSCTALLVLLTTLVLLAAACSQAGTGLKPEEVPADAGGAEGRDVDGGAVPPVAVDEGGNFAGGEQPTGQTDRSIIKTGEITVEVENVPGPWARSGPSPSSWTSSSTTRYRARSRMPRPSPCASRPDRFEDAIAAIHDLDGEVKAEATNEKTSPRS